MMNKIHILSERVANKIAAGEVVERPASIVKELLENSLDAGATSIEVTVNHGGKSLIRIADNGSGMSPHDAELAFKRHATSKIKSDEDLSHIASFGFRGEALPSISAVSRMTLVTRPHDAETGTEIWMVGGALAKAKETSASLGTVVEVRDLFFNTPARRKFLKQDSTEFGHIHEVLAAAALANPKVHFVFKNQEKTIWDLAPCVSAPAARQSISSEPAAQPVDPNYRERIKAVLGADWGDMLIPVEAQIPHVKVSGFITKPEFARGNRLTQYIYVNQRWVKSFAVSYAIEGGYHGFLMHGRYPAVVLFVDVHPEYVDVNVHPTKQQVRLSGEASIKSMIQSAIADALRKAPDLSPTLVDRVPSPESRVPSETTDTPGVDRGHPRGWDRSAEPQTDFSDTPISQWETALKETAATFSGAREPELEVWKPIGKGDRPVITKVLGQVHGTFILAETEEGYVVIDQHAAHEKIQFESLRQNLEKSNPVSQRLLIEEMFDLTPRHFAVYEEHENFLRKIGFDIELFGERTLVIRAVPQAFRDENPKQVLTTYFEQKETGEAGVRLENFQADLAAMLACKTKSVKAHDSLNMEEMRRLTDELMRCDQPFHCPHGRPSMLKYSFAELERQFKRKL